MLFEAVDRSSERLHTCFAVVQDDPSGSYIYFTLRYPTERVQQHVRGEALATSDRIIIDLHGDRAISLTLVFEAPVLAKARYPSQMKRFNGLHEVTAFVGGSPFRPTRQVSAQAFERVEESNEGRKNIVTVLGRIDAGLVEAIDQSTRIWPIPAVKNLGIGLQVFRSDSSAPTPSIAYAVPASATGEAVVSLQKAYLGNVPSGARIDILHQGKEPPIWSTIELGLADQLRRRDWTQRLSDWWAPKLMALLGKPYGGEPVKVRVEFGSGSGPLVARATSEAAPLPDVATRAFGWLSAAFILTMALVIVGTIAVVRLLRVTRSAWGAAVSISQPHKPRHYGRKRDEISTLGRVLNLLLARNRSRNKHLVERMARERSELHLSQELLVLRHDRLDAIGHEIRSPLQALLIRTKEDAVLQGHLKRMDRAVEALIDAESVEDGIGGLEIVLNDVDVSLYLARLVDAKKSQHPYLHYQGPPPGTYALLDPIQFEQVIDHLIDNARRYRRFDGAVIVRLREDSDAIVAEVFNEGPSIPVDRLEVIFKFGSGDRLEPANRGIGLFAARGYLLKMKATIHAENQLQGVAFVMRLKKVS